MKKALLALLLAGCTTATPPPPSAPAALKPLSDVSYPALRDELLAMQKVDQEVRSRWIKDRNNPALQDEVNAVDDKNVARLKVLLAKYGWPGKSMVGPKAAGGAWMIAQHGGIEFLHEMIPVMYGAVLKGELEGALYATSVDRVRIQEGKQQVYGSQFDTEGDKCEPLPILDPETVDDRRKAVGMGPLSEYAAQLCALYKQKK